MAPCGTCSALLAAVAALAALAAVAAEAHSLGQVDMPSLPVHVKPLGFAAQRHRLNGVQRQGFCTEEAYPGTQLRVSVRGIDGECEGKVTVVTKEMTDWNKEFRLVHDRPFSAKPDRPFSSTITTDKLRGRRICVSIRCDSLLKGITAEIRVLTPEQGVAHKPDKSETSPVCGLADLHLHQFASLGFGGNWFEESYQGPFKNEKSESLGFVNKGIHGFQQIHEKWLREAHRKGLTLAVVPAVNNDFICFGFVKYSCEDMSSALRQVHAAVEFARKNSDWYEIALDPWHARRIIKAGKLAAILAIEVSELFPHKYGSWRDQLDYVYSLGVRSIIAVHEIDNRFAGAAPHMDVIKWLNLIKRGHFFKLDPTGMHNMRGLTDEGRELFTEFMSRNMLIDLAHLSRESWRGVAKLSASRGYPLFDSHSRFAAMVDEERRKEYREFIVDEEKLELIKSRRGVVGLRTSFDYAETFVPPPGSSLKAVPNDCDGSSKSLAQQVQYANSRGLPVTFGCDMNGFAGQTGPRFGKWACPNPKGSKRVERHSLRMRQAQLQKEGIGSLFDTEGAAHVDLLPDLVSDLKLVGANTTSIENSAEHVLRMWERAYGDTSDAARPFAKDCSFFAHKAKPQQAQQFKDLPIDLMVDADLNESAMKEKVATAEGEHLRPKAKEPKEGDERIV